MIEVYHHRESVCAQKVCVTLEEKQVDWTSRYVALEKQEQFAPEYLALNPKGVVPTLVDDGKVVIESTAICEYIDEAFEGPSLMPSDAHGKALVRKWTTAIDAGIHAPHCLIISYTAAFRFFFMKRMGGIEPVREMAKRNKNKMVGAAQLEALEKGFDSVPFKNSLAYMRDVFVGMDQALDGNDWLVGEHISLADLAYLPYLVRVQDLGLSGLWDKSPNVAALLERLKARPAYQSGFLEWRDPNWLGGFEGLGHQNRGDIQRVLAEVLG